MATNRNPSGTPQQHGEDEFRSFVRKAEGGEEHRTAAGQWMPYADEAGKWTIGRGHLINGGRSSEGFEAGLDDNQVEALFDADLGSARDNVRNKFGGEAFDRLPPRSQQMLTDFEFNLGDAFMRPRPGNNRAFPKFVAHVRAGEIELALGESDRFLTDPKTGAKLPLGRNKAFREFFGRDTNIELPEDVPQSQQHQLLGTYAQASEDDNAERLYEESRQHDVDLEDEINRFYQEEDARLAAGGPQEFGAVPDPSRPRPESQTGDDDTSTTLDVAKAVLTGLPKEAADFIDNASDIFDDLGITGGIKNKLEQLGLPEVFGKGLRDFAQTEGQPEVRLRDVLDQALGQPETGAGKFAETFVGQLGLMIPAMRSVKVAGLLGAGIRNLAVPAAVAATTLGRDEGNLSTMAVTEGEGTVFDNAVTRALAVTTDDSTAERILKTFIEDVPLGILGEGVIKVGGPLASAAKGRIVQAVRRTRADRMRKASLKEAAERQRVEVPDEVAEPAGEVAALRGRLELLEPTAADLKAELKAAADDAAEASEQAASDVLSEPLGMARQPVLDANLSGLDDSSFDAHKAGVNSQLDDLEARFDAEPDLAQTDAAFKQELIQAQDAFSSSELESFRRSLLDADPSEIVHTLRNLNLSVPEDKVRALLISDVVDSRGLADEVGSAIETVRSQSPDHAEVLSGKLDDFAKTIDESTDDAVDAAGEIDPNAEALSSADELRQGIIDELDKDIAATKAQLEAAEGRLAVAADASEADGRVLEAIRQDLKAEGKLTPEVDEALGRAATRNTPDAPAPRQLFHNYLEADAADVAAVQTHLEAGDLDSAAKSLGSIFDSTNYEKIAESGDITDLLKLVGRVFGNTKQSTRLQTVRGLAETEDMARGELARLAAENGTSPERIAAALEASLPGANLDVQLNSLRMLELSLGHRVRDLSQKLGRPETSTLDRLDFARYAVLLANVNDRRSGIVSEIGRALSSLRNEVSVAGFDDILAAGREIRSGKIDSLVNEAGGIAKIERMAQVVRGSVDADTATKVIAQTVNDHTVSDMLYNAFIMNILSGLGTQSVNMAGNIVRAAVINPTIKVAEQAAVALIERDPGAYKVVTQYLIGAMEGARAGLIQNGSFREGLVAQAFKRGRRVTAGDSVRFLDDSTPQGLLRRDKIADLLRRGAPLNAGHLFPKIPLFPLPQRGRNAVANYFQSRTGPGAKNMDWVGRVMEYPVRAIDGVGALMETPGKLLAAGDELASSINYAGQLRADATEHARDLGLSGAEMIEHIERLQRDVPNVEALLKRMDPADTKRAAYLTQLDEMNTRATNHARRGTYTEPAGDRLKQFMKLRDTVPVVRWFLPFVRTPANLLMSAGRDFTPIGATNDLLKLHGTGNTREQAKAAGRFALTAGFMAGVWDLAEKGKITGGGPHNPAERESWLQNNVPYSIKFDWMPRPVPINRMDPIAIPLLVTADLIAVRNRMDQDKFDSLQQELIGRVMEQFKSKSFLEGTSTMMHAFEDPARYGRRWIVSTAENTMIPGSRFWASLDRGGLPVPDDLVHREPGDSEFVGTLKDFVRGDKTRPLIQDEKDFFGGKTGVDGGILQLGSSIRSHLPAGASDAFTNIWNQILETEMEASVVAQRDIYYNVRTLPGAWGPDIASPYLDSNLGPFDPASAEQARLGYGQSVNNRFGSIDGVKLTPTQQDKLHRYFAKPDGGTDFHELLMKEIFQEDGRTYNDQWAKRGDTFDGESGGTASKVARLNQIYGNRMQAAILRLRREDAGLNEILTQQTKDRILMNRQEGVNQIREREGFEPQDLRKILDPRGQN